MKIEDIEKAGKIYIENLLDYHIDTFTYKYGVWVGDNGESYPGKELTRRDIKVICWQPIPSFDEILEANRDVLERIKEKGD